MKHSGSCHCGKVAIEVEGQIDSVLSCNCSMCQRKGALLWFVPRERLQVIRGEGELATYTFNRHVIRHHFCPTCGIHPFGEGTGPDGAAMAAINARCLEGVELDTLPIHHYDGRSL
ncbi:GFA family protein [Agrilutibacter solisilvae]|uniref:GFA family protein n=1 Tax=Agrilutibacter solisilvae TaxID=2763317 RepID=A0A974Y0H2_9GAMM|nr:GFA family protein [Lysobacter solisilvae]QSX79157.1 GFA family protein [Lysobacter solisilvae]